MHAHLAVIMISTFAICVLVGEGVHWKNPKHKNAQGLGWLIGLLLMVLIFLIDLIFRQ